MQGSINKLNLTTEIGNLKITAKFMTPLDPAKLLKPNVVDLIIHKEFDYDLEEWENIKRIRNGLRPFCYEVAISPQLTELRYSYEIIKS